MSTTKFDCNLGVIAQTRHWHQNGVKVAYEPYVREMRIWGSLFKQIDIFATLSTEEIKVSVSEYGFPNINFELVSYSHSTKLWGAFVRFIQLPVVLSKLFRFIWRHEVLLIRSPSHLGLFAHIFVFLLRKKSITKYAGYFSFFEGERIPSIIERNFIKNILRQPHYVLVYGPSTSSHLISFIPAAISKTEISTLKALRKDKIESQGKIVFYSLGKLIQVKDFDLAIVGFGLLFQEYPDYNWEYHLIGDGLELDNLVELCGKYNISDRVFFEGKLSYENAIHKLVSADVVLMPGRKEGWPKVVIEGWAVGAVPLVADAGISSHIIRDTVNGFLFKPEPNALKEQLVVIFKATNSLSEIRKTGWEEVEHFSIEEFSKGIEDICRNKLKL